MKKPAVNIFLMLAILVASIFLIKTSFALWSHKAAVGFTLNISQPQEEEFCCGHYTTIQEGINILRDIKYIYIYNKMDQFENALEARVVELNNLPPGGITLEELQEECKNYQNVAKGLKNIIKQYKHCLDGLADFYRNSSQEDKDEVPDFWDQHNSLCDLQEQLKDEKLKDIEDLIKAVREAGKEKIG
jgi:hypothetical protein